MAASRAPSAPNNADSMAINRSGTMAASTCSASVVTVPTRTAGNVPATAARTASVRRYGLRSVRTTNWEAMPVSWNAFRYIVGGGDS